MGPFEDSVFIYGTTHASVETQSLIKNPLRRSDVWVRVHGGKGIYIEDDGSKPGLVSGITRTTIDVRSVATAEPYLIELIVKNGSPVSLAAVAA